MRKIILTTESGADLSKEACERHHILTVPFGLNFPDRTVDDGQIPVQEIYDFYKATKAIPKTNAVSPYQYMEFFRAAAEAEPGCEIIHVGYSSACSCSFQNAVLGVRELGDTVRVHLIDALNVSGGLGNMVLKAAEIIEGNPDDTAEELVEKIAFRFLDDFLEGKEFDRRRIYLFYAEGADLELMGRMKAYLEERGFEQVHVGVLGCVMTVHGGKGAIGVSATER